MPFARPKWVQAGLSATVAVALGGVVLAGLDDGEPVQDVRLLSGAAWLTSSKVGQVTLLDGSSAEVAAQVQVAPAGDTLEVAQQGSTAYAIDQTAGTVRRVDGATFDLGSPQEPIPDTSSGLTVIPAPEVVYALDSRRGVLANTDPRDLTRRGDLVTLAGELRTGSATVDDRGTLWAIDTRTGDLTYVADGSRHVRRGVTQPGPSVLAITDGNPVVVDIAARKLIRISRDNGLPGTTIDLDLRTSDTVQVTGSAHSDRLYLVASRGVITICKLSSDKCDTAIPLTTGNEYGTAVEAGNRVFVPDYTTGEVVIIDPTRARVITKSVVLTPPSRFQLLVRDGVVFYNDTFSERAGVIQLDGSLLKASKYNPGDPQSGLSGPQHNTTQPPQPNPSGQANQPGQTTGPAQPAGTQVAATDPTRPSRPADRPADRPGDRPTDRPAPPVTPTTTPKPPDPTQPPPKDVPDLEIAISKATPVENEAVTLQVNDKKGKVPVSAHWTFGDGEGSGVTTTHKWAKAQTTPYLVTVKVKMAGDEDEYTASVNVTVSETPKFRLTVSVPGGGGTVTDPTGAINCPSTCFVDVKQDTQITLTAHPDATHNLGSWSGACSGAAATCDVTLGAAKSVVHTFELKPIPKETLTITVPNGGSIAGPGGAVCPGTCVFTLERGSTAVLTARDGTQLFSAWQGDCASAPGNQCTLTMNGPRNVSAKYNPKPYLNSLTCNPIGGGRFKCTADAGPSMYYDGIRWFYGGLGVARPAPDLTTGCAGNTFDVRFTMAGLERTATVRNCT
jgi:hypothetical protein